MTEPWLILVESNTTGSGRQFARCARDGGLRPVLFARDPARYPYVAEDGLDHRVVDTTSPDALLRASAALPGTVAGVISSSEYFIATASDLAARLGRPHADGPSVQACRDKFTQRQRLREAGVPGPAFATAASAGAAVEAAAGLGLPVVVKPVAGSGSIGVRLCTDLESVRAAASHILDTDPAALGLPPQPSVSARSERQRAPQSRTKGSSVVVERYVDGAEYSVETLDDQVIGVTRKHLGAPPYFVELGHDFPAPLPREDSARLGEVALAALKALGLGWGAAHIELRVNAEGPWIVEVNPRLAGGMIPRLVLEATGVDLVAAVVARAVGRAHPALPVRGVCATIRFLVAPGPGRLAAVDGVVEARASPGVVDVGVTGRPGQDLTPRHSFQDRLAYVIATGGSTRAATDAAEAGRRLLRVRLST